MLVKYTHRVFHFKQPSGTSRGVLTKKQAWFIEIVDLQNNFTAIGECSIIEGLTPEYQSFSQYNELVENACQYLEQLLKSFAPSDALNELRKNADFRKKSSLLFGMECALLNLVHKKKHVYFENDFSKGLKKIPINGLIWMGSKQEMSTQIENKLNEGFTTIKMKIGAIDYSEEIQVLQDLRDQYSSDDICIRVDANGAFDESNVEQVLKDLANLSIHSIEQPIKPGNITLMKKLCKTTLCPIALDEEMIGITTYKDKKQLIEDIQPQYIVLKPSLHGGIYGTQEWIEIAEANQIPWWITSALESNVGLTAICQLTAEYPITLPQGLGTGSLYTDNIPGELCVRNGEIFTLNEH